MKLRSFTPGVTDAGAPRAALGGFPYPGHGTLADEAVNTVARRSKWRGCHNGDQRSWRASKRRQGLA